MFTTKTKQTTPTEVPALTIDPEFAKVQDALSKAQADLATVEAERRSILEVWNAQASQTRGDRVRSAAELYLQGKDFNAIEAEHPANNKRLGELNQRRPVLETAIEQLQRRLESLRYHASVRICDSLKPRHAEIARRIAFGVAEMVRGARDWRDFTTALEARNVQFNMAFTPLQHQIQKWMPGAADHAAQQGLFWALLRWAIDAGGITESEAKELAAGSEIAGAKRDREIESQARRRAWKLEEAEREQQEKAERERKAERIRSREARVDREAGVSAGNNWKPAA